MTFARSLSGALALLATLLAGQAVATTPMNIRVYRINDHLLCFYDGRPAQSSVPPGDATWDDAGANYVGVATYAIISGDRALVYDAYPSVRQAKWVRDYLEHAGIHHFVLVNSHWHLDHVGGNAVYADSDVIATARTRQLLVTHQAAIEAGTQSGPPAITPLRLPTLTITADTTYYVGGIKVELRPVNIHSADGLVINLPGDHILLAGDTLEDTVTFISEPEQIPEQVRNLAAMKQWGFDRILPNHGNPEVIAKGGYTLALIDFTRIYLQRLVEHAHDADFLHQSLDSYVDAAVRDGTVSVWWAYRDAHQENLAKVAKVWSNQPTPQF